MAISYELESDFSEVYAQTNLAELDIDKAKIIRSIESMKVMGVELNPQNLAFELGIPKALLYQDLEILQYVYKNQTHLTGVDKLVAELIDKIKFKNRHITRLKNQVSAFEKELETIFNDGFVQGAAVSYQNKSMSPELAKELWARGVLYFSLETELNSANIKSAYRRLVTLFHPDQSAKDTAAYLDTLKKAYDLLISIYA